MTLIGLAKVTGDARDVRRSKRRWDPCAHVFEEESSRRRVIGNRPQLLLALEHLGSGDRLVVRRARELVQSMADGWKVLIDLIEQGFAVRILEGSDAGDYDKPSDVRESAREVTEIRRDILSERIEAGLRAARERRVVGGRPRVTDHATRTSIFAQRGRGETLRAIVQSLGVSVGTVQQCAKSRDLRRGVIASLMEVICHRT